jgi:hypothetical protein
MGDLAFAVAVDLADRESPSTEAPSVSFQAWSVAELSLTRPLNPALALASLSRHLLRSRQPDDLDVGMLSDCSDL